MPQVDSHVAPIVLDADNYMFSRGERWYLRMNLPGSKQFVRSLKISSVAGENEKVKAIQKAQEIIQQTRRKLELDLPPGTLTVQSLAKQFIQLGEEGVKVNEDAGRIITRLPGVPGKKQGAWTRKTLDQHIYYIDEIILPYWSKGRLARKSISDITQMEMDGWVAWRAKKYPDYAPSSIRHQNITFRHLFRLAQAQGERFIPPIISDPPAELRSRRRPDVQESQYQEMIAYLWGKTNKTDRHGNELFGTKEKFAYLHICYLETLRYTGIRPFSSPANAIKMKDIDWDKDDEGNDRIILKRVEKNKEYYAVCSQNWRFVLDRLHHFYQQFEIDSDREYLFVHPESIPGNNIHKGEPIKNFNTSWKNMIKHLKYNEGKTQQKDRITKYGIRHMAISERLLENKMTFKEIAEFHGTSMQMVDTIYAHINIKENYDRLMQKDKDAGRWIEIFTDGVSFQQIERNSSLHHVLYKAHPEWFLVAPDPDIVLPSDASIERMKRRENWQEIKDAIIRGRK